LRKKRKEEAKKTGANSNDPINMDDKNIVDSKSELKGSEDASLDVA